MEQQTQNSILPNLVQTVYEFLSRGRKGYAPARNYASQIGHPCERKLVYERLNWEEKSLTSAHSQMIFRLGRMFESDVIRLLQDSGFAIIEQQRPFSDEKYQISGKVDFRIKIDGQNIPTEYKTINEYDFDELNSINDMLLSSKSWVQSWPAQIMIYLFLSNEENGIMLLQAKQSGRLKQINIKMDYEYCESLLKKLERVNEHVKNKTYPDRIKDLSVCQYCDFKHICLPDEHYEAVTVTDDKELFEQLELRERLKPMRREYEKIDEQIKERFKKEQDGTFLVGGRFQVVAKTKDKKFYNVPEDIEKQYLEYKPQTRIDIKDLDAIKRSAEGEVS